MESVLGYNISCSFWCGVLPIAHFRMFFKVIDKLSERGSSLDNCGLLYSYCDEWPNVFAENFCLVLNDMYPPNSFSSLITTRIILWVDHGSYPPIFFACKISTLWDHRCQYFLALRQISVHLLM